jgi:hypothetical protein
VASFSATILSFPPRARGNQLVRVGICFEWRYRTNRKTHEIIETADHRDESGIKSVVQGVAMTQMTKALGYQDVASLFMRDAAQRHLV